MVNSFSLARADQWSDWRANMASTLIVMMMMLMLKRLSKLTGGLQATMCLHCPIVVHFRAPTFWPILDPNLHNTSRNPKHYLARHIEASPH